MAELLDTIREQIRERLDELRPFLDELTRLEQALVALEGSDGGPAAAPPKPAPAGRRARGGAEKRAPAEREELRERTLTLIGERPGVSKTELREQLGLSGPEAGQFLRRLLDAEAVEEQTLPSGTVGYHVIAASSTSVAAAEPDVAPEPDAAPAPDAGVETELEVAAEPEPAVATEPDAVVEAEAHPADA